MAEKVFGIEQEIASGGEFKALEHADVYEVLESILGLQPQDLDAIQMHGPNPRRVDVCTKSLEVWQRKGIDQHIEKKYFLTSGKTVIIVRPF